MTEIEEVIAAAALRVYDELTNLPAGRDLHIQAVLESAWKATVMTIPRGRRILVTSDHGSLFLGAGLSFFRHSQDVRPLSMYLGGERWARLSGNGELPAHEDLAVYRERDIAVLRGRVQPHPPGPASINCTSMADCH